MKRRRRWAIASMSAPSMTSSSVWERCRCRCWRSRCVPGSRSRARGDNRRSYGGASVALLFAAFEPVFERIDGSQQLLAAGLGRGALPASLLEHIGIDVVALLEQLEFEA